MGGGDCGNSRDFRRIVPGSILDSVERSRKMTDQEFGRWYNWVKGRAAEYQDVRSRTAVIAGFFEACSEEVFSGDQVSQILALRYPEKE